MKKFYTLVVLLPILVFSQSKYLGFYNNNDVGAIVSIENDTFQIDYELYDNGIPFDRLVEINGMLYGITTHPPLIGMGHGPKVLYRYDYTNESFEVLMRLDTGYDSYSNLIAGGGKLYSFKVGGDPLYGGEGFLVEIDPVTLNVTELVNLSSHNIDHHDFVDFVYAPNNKLYGIVRTGGANDEGILFSYDLTTGTYTVEYEFGSTMGKFPIHIISHSNGKLYGVTEDGGANDHGTIFEFDTNNNVYTKLYDLTQTNEAYTLVEGDTNKLYGFTNEHYNGGGRIYQFDIATNTFTNLHYFSTGTGPTYLGYDPRYNPLLYKNHTLYGTNIINSHAGMLFSYDLNNDEFNEYSIYFTANDGQTYPLVKTHDDRIFFNTTENFFESYGALYEFNTSSNSIIKKNGVKYGTNGTYPTKMIISSHNGLVYGITATTFNDYGSRLFSYNYETGEYQVLINFSIEDYGNPPNGIIESSNGLIYVTTAFSVGLGGQGKIIEYNPYNNTHSVVHNFSEQSGPAGNFGAVLYPIGLLEENNIIYGYKVHGGGNILENGTFFSFNTLTHTYNILYESADLAHVSAMIAAQPDNKNYGFTTVGGTQNLGYLFSFDIHSGAFNVIESLDQYGRFALTQTSNGNVYGVIQHHHGTEGCIFKVDANDNFSIYYQFDNTNNPSTGYYPDYITAIGNNLYVISFAPACNYCTRNLLTEVNTDNYSFRNIADIEQLGDRTIYQISYVMNDDRLIGEDYYGFYSYYHGNNSITQINIPTDVYHLMDITNAHVSVPEITLKNNLIIYPNPASKYISIKLNNSSVITEVSILNSSGEQIIKKTNTDKIDISNLKNGIYFIKVKGDKHLTVKKVIIE